MKRKSLDTMKTNDSILRFRIVTWTHCSELSLSQRQVEPLNAKLDGLIGSLTSLVPPFC